MRFFVAVSVVGVALGACQPQVETSPQTGYLEPIIVAVDYDSQITLNGEKVNEQEFYARLEQMVRDANEKPNP